MEKEIKHNIRVGDFIEYDDMLGYKKICQVYEVKGTSVMVRHDGGYVGFDTELTKSRYTILSKEEIIKQYQKKFKKLGMYIDYIPSDETRDYYDSEEIDEDECDEYHISKYNTGGIRIEIAEIHTIEKTVHFYEGYRTKQEVDLIFELYEWCKDY